MNGKIRVIVALSGGIDSSVSALLLKSLSLPLDIRAVFMHNWDEILDDGNTRRCPTASRDYHDALQTANSLNIPISTVDFTKEYWTRVFEPMVHSLDAGNTPNPDVGCNRYIKFGALTDLLLKKSCSSEAATRNLIMERINDLTKDCETNFLERLKSRIANEKLLVSKNPVPLSSIIGNADFVVTGHYARIGTDYNNKPTLMRAFDTKKDQSYFLSNVSRNVLRNAIFPLGSLPKSRVKQIAQDSGLLSHLSKKRESMGICFVEPSKRFGDFMGEYLEDRPGKFVSLDDGVVKGKHTGFFKYTIGQCARISGESEKWFVAAKDSQTSNIFVVPG
ncbi:hypothetical protein HK100_011501, partial [Physocladia obscura]